MLPDGRMLLLGGVNAESVSAGGSIGNSDSLSLMPINGRLKIARAWHSATLLPDGTILVFGVSEPPERKLRERKSLIPRAEL